MKETPDRSLERIRENLHYVARDAERLSPTELVHHSHEFHRAAHDIDELMLRSKKIGILQLTIGSVAVEALNFRKNAYDFLEAEHDLAEPGDQYKFLFIHRVRTDTLSRTTEPFYGFVRYFNLATISRTLEDGGDLSLIEPDSSSST